MPRVKAAISVRAPLRIALGGGGTDLPSHYGAHGGFVVSAAIDRRVQLTVGESDGRVTAWSTWRSRRSPTQPTFATRSCGRRSPGTATGAR